MKTRVLVLHSDPAVLSRATGMLEAEGLEVEGARGLVPSPGPLATAGPDAILVGGALESGGDPGGTWHSLRALFPDAALLVLAPQAGAEATLARLGTQIDDLVAEPLERGRLLVSLRNALARRRLERRVAALSGELARSTGFDFLVARSEAMRRAVELLRRAAANRAPLLLHGIEGTPRELAARAVHATSERALAAFVSLDLAALPEGRQCAELFGDRTSGGGTLEQAGGGTLYLAHVERLSSEAQDRLARALGEALSPRLIGSTSLSVSALRDALGEPLGAQLCAQEVRMPALAERAGDVPALAWTLLRNLGLRHGRELEGLSPAAAEALEAHDFPGDVRELEDVLERALLVEAASRLEVRSLPVRFHRAPSSPAGHPQATGAGTPTLARSGAETTFAAEPSQPNGASLALLPHGTVLPFQELERRILLHALRTTGWNVQEAARRLKLGRATIYRKIDRYGLKREAS